MSTDSKSTPASGSATVRWTKLLTGYHWFVISVASAAWFFDCLDQRLFSLARVPALQELMRPGHTGPLVDASNNDLQAYGKIVTACFLIGWGIGGMVFGSLGDKFGRARMLTITILIYSAFTGLSFLSHTALDFTIARFLTGVGVGGVFGLAVSLIAETVPSGARLQCLGLLQILSTIGNVTAGFVKMGIDQLEYNKVIAAGDGWRWMFLIGALPACMIIFTARFLKEPEPWLRLKQQGLLPRGSIFAPYSRLLADKRWKKNLIVGTIIASTGVVGLWAIGEYAVDLQKVVFKQHFQPIVKARMASTAAKLEIAGTAIASEQKADTPKTAEQQAEETKAFDGQVKAEVNWAIAVAYLYNMFGAAIGMWIFARLAQVSRKLAFAIGFSAAMIVTFLVYWKLTGPPAAYWMMFLMGMAQLSVFAGFAIYLPELFPSTLRSTGTSFCYNFGRFAAAAGSFFSATLTKEVFGGYTVDPSLPLRYAAMTMCAIFLAGLLVLPFAPETKGHPLPE